MYAIKNLAIKLSHRIIMQRPNKKKESSRAEMRFGIISSLIDRTMQMLESHEILEMLRIALVCTLNTSSR